MSARKGILTIAILLGCFMMETHAETFELLNYTPPRGWVQQSIPDGMAYKRSNGIGLVAIYASTVSGGDPAAEFSKVWQQRVGSLVPGPIPKPETQKDGDTTVAIGAQPINAQGTITSVTVSVFLSRGRAQAVLTMSAGNDVQSEVAAFLNSLSVAKNAAANGNADADIAAPPGYRSERQAGGTVLRPIASTPQAQCTYVIGGDRPSSGSLETDARRSILEPIPGAQIGSYTMSMRGVGGEGWPYHIIHAEVQGTSSSVNSIAAAASPGRVQMLWSVGPKAACTGDETSLAYILNSLRPKGWMADPNAFANALAGSWLNSQTSGIGKYKFLPGGRYEYGVGTSTTFGPRETTTGSHNTGSWKLNGSTLTLTPDRRDVGTKRMIARVMEKSLAGSWSRFLLLLDTTTNPPLDVSYDRVQN